MPSFVQTGMKSNAMCDFENTNGGYNSPVPNPLMFTPESMARADTSNTHGGIASAKPSSTPREAKIYPTFAASAPASSIMTSKTMASLGSKDAYLDKASTSYSNYRPTLSNVGSPTFQDLIKKGRKAQADDERTVYETKKAKQEANRAKATRARLATDTAVRSLALESRIDIDACKGKLIIDMEKNLRALLESEIRAEIREKVYEDEKKISAAYEREIKDSTRLQLENELEPVIMAELSAKHEKEVKETLRAGLESEVKEELRARYKAEFEEDMRLELEDTVRKELKDMYRDEIRSELKRELSPGIRAELIASLDVHHAVPDLDDLDNQQSSYLNLGITQHLNYKGDYQGYEGESQYDEEEGDDVFDDAPEQLGSGLVDGDHLPNPIIDADDFESGLMNTDNLPSPIVDPSQLGCDLVNNDHLPHPITNADRSRSGATSIGSQHLKRHIDEDYDESDEEEHSGVDRPAEKRVKITPCYDLMADEGSPSANNINGDHIDEQALVDGAQHGENDEDGDYFQVNGNVNFYHGEDQLQKDGVEKEDAGSPILNGNSNAYYGIGPIQNNGEKKEFGYFPPVNSNLNAFLGEEQPQDANSPKGDGCFPDLDGNAYGNGNENYAEERPKNHEVQYDEMQYEPYENGEGGNAGYLSHDSKSNAFDYEEERDSEAEGLEEEEEEEEEEEDESEDDEEDEEEDDVGDNGLPYERAQEPLGNYYRGRQINRADRSITRGMKHSRSEEDEGDEENEAHDSKRHHGWSYPNCEDEYSEADSSEDDYESESPDAPGEQSTCSLIKESNTQETAFVIDSSDDEDNSEAVDEEKTLVDDGDFLSSKIQTYVGESHFVQS